MVLQNGIQNEIILIQKSILLNWEFCDKVIFAAESVNFIFFQQLYLSSRMTDEWEENYNFHDVYVSDRVIVMFAKQKSNICRIVFRLYVVLFHFLGYHFLLYFRNILLVKIYITGIYQNHSLCNLSSKSFHLQQLVF